MAVLARSQGGGHGLGGGDLLRFPPGSSRRYRPGGAMPAASLSVTRWIDVSCIRHTCASRVGRRYVGRLVERLGPLALSVDIGCLARTTGRGYDE